jgi:hypothetical protein
MIQIGFRGTEELDDLAQRLAEAPRRLRDELRKGLAAAARPAVQDLRREIRGVSMAQTKRWVPRSRRLVGNSLGRGSSPLRSPIAAAVQVKAEVNGDGASVQIQLDEAQVPTRGRWLTPYVVGRKKRLRHPFMGRWRYAVQATGDLNVWWPTLQKHMRRFAAARDAAAASTERSLEG